VEVYDKQQLLAGQNFSPSTISEQLSLFVLSYDSFRTSKREGRKAWQENAHLAPFIRQNQHTDSLLAGTDASALIQVVRAMNPIVVVDESHHATSALSLEMLGNFNPSFILELTATPHRNSNIISLVNAMQLKKENMVKLPVIVYNRKTQEDVFGDAIHLRNRLEQAAEKETAATGRYIRPIVLFQAQPRTTEDSTTFGKIKKTLIACGIPEEQIAIRTSETNELRQIDLNRNGAHPLHHHGERVAGRLGLSFCLCAGHRGEPKLHGGCGTDPWKGAAASGCKEKPAGRVEYSYVITS
jgi:type III restriction enzyme